MSTPAEHREALPHGWRLVVLPEVDSTNEELRRRRDSEPGEGLCISAAIQTAGRGRRGRAWSSPTGNLYVSVRLAQPARLGDGAQLSFVTAVALSDAVLEVAPHLTPRLKWPNDVLLSGAKLSGILLETDGPWIILGCGVNVAWAPESTGATYPATSLRAEGAMVAVDEFRLVFLRHLSGLVDLWRRSGFAPILAAWKSRAQGLGGTITARLQSGEEYSGIFVDLDADGALMLQTDAGRRRILAGDVFFPAV